MALYYFLIEDVMRKELSNETILQAITKLRREVKLLADANTQMAQSQAAFREDQARANATAAAERKQLFKRLAVMEHKVDGHGKTLAEARGGLTVGRWIFGLAFTGVAGTALSWIYLHWKQLLEALR